MYQSKFLISIGLFLFCVFYTTSGDAQHFDVDRRYDAYDGLPESGIKHIAFGPMDDPILIDKNNLLYVLRTGKFRVAPGFPGDIEIKKILRGPGNILWILDIQGSLYSFDPSRYRYRAYRPVSSITGSIEDIFASNDHLFLVSGNHIFEISQNPNGSYPLVLEFEDIPTKGMILNVSYNGTTYLVITSDGYAWSLEGPDNSWEQIKLGRELHSVSNSPEGDILCLDEESQDVILYENNKVHRRVELPKGESFHFKDVINGPDGEIWMIGYQTIHVFNYLEEALTPVGYRIFSDTILSSMTTTDNHENEVWIFDGSVLEQLDVKDLEEGLVKPVVNIQSVTTDKKNGRIFYRSDRSIEVYSSELTFNFTNPENEYLFRFKESSEGEIWSEFSIRNTYKRSNLKPGKYALEVQAIHPSGLLSEKKYNYKVLSPIWFLLPKWIFLVGFGVLLISFIILLNLSIKRKKEKKKIEYLKVQIKQVESDLKTLQLQINPHFIFNFLAGIKGLIHMGQTDTAAKYTGMASSLMRELLDSSSKKWHPLNNELEMMKEFITIENFRSGKSIAFRTGGEYDPDILVPPLFFQPIIENSMQHAFKGKKTGTISIDLLARGRYLNVKIKDSGIGFRNKEIKDKAVHALNILEERIKLYIQNPPGNIWAIKSEPGEGTEIAFILPFKHQ